MVPDHRRRVGLLEGRSRKRTAFVLDVHSVVCVDDNFVRWRLAVGAVHSVFVFWTGLREVGVENRSSTMQRRIAACSRSLVLPSLAANVGGDMGLVGWSFVFPEVAVVTRPSSSNTFGRTSAVALFCGSVWWVSHAHRHRRDAWRLPVVLVLFVASPQARLDVWMKNVILDIF